MRSYSVVQDEGVASAADTVQAQTTALLSCIGIVFFCQHSWLAGMFHYGASSLYHPRVRRTIITMINDLGPSHIFLTAPPIATSLNYGQGSTQQDRNRLDRFLGRYAGGITRQWLPDQTWSSYGVWDGEFRVNYRHLDDATRHEIAPAVARADADGRYIFGNIIFYSARDLITGHVPRGVTADDMTATMDRLQAARARNTDFI
jgi:hypothetical protein